MSVHCQKILVLAKPTLKVGFGTIHQTNANHLVMGDVQETRTDLNLLRIASGLVQGPLDHLEVTIVQACGTHDQNPVNQVCGTRGVQHYSPKTLTFLTLSTPSLVFKYFPRFIHYWRCFLGCWLCCFQDQEGFQGMRHQRGWLSVPRRDQEVRSEVWPGHPKTQG